MLYVERLPKEAVSGEILRRRLAKRLTSVAIEGFFIQVVREFCRFCVDNYQVNDVVIHWDSDAYRKVRLVRDEGLSVLPAHFPSKQLIWKIHRSDPFPDTVPSVPGSNTDGWIRKNCADDPRTGQDDLPDTMMILMIPAQGSRLSR